MKPNEKLTNFIPLSREFFESHLWTQKRIFSKAEAKLDLYQMAKYTDGIGKVYANDKLITYFKDEIPASYRFLVKRWCWGKGKISNFLDELKKDGAIDTRLCNGQTVIKIIDYQLRNKQTQERDSRRDTCNPMLESVSGDGRDSNSTKSGTVTGQKPDKYNISNIVNSKEREDKPSPTPSPDLYSQEDREVFEKLQNWISINTPFVAKMKCQITIDEFIRLRKKSWYTNENLMSILGKMDNYKGVNKNIYVYRTVLNWAEREYNK